MIDPLVRSATASDIGALRFLEDEARAALADQRGGLRWLETHPRRGDGWLASVESGDAIVGHIDEVVIGYLVLAVDDELATIEEVYVTPGARELGFGDALLAEAIDRSRQRSASLLEGTSLPGDRDTKNLYERAGIKARLIVVSTPL